MFMETVSSTMNVEKYVILCNYVYLFLFTTLPQLHHCVSVQVCVSIFIRVSIEWIGVI